MSGMTSKVSNLTKIKNSRKKKKRKKYDSSQTRSSVEVPML
jgi:hypothetical protein